MWAGVSLADSGTGSFSYSSGSIWAEVNADYNSSMQSSSVSRSLCIENTGSFGAYLYNTRVYRIWFDVVPTLTINSGGGSAYRDVNYKLYFLYGGQKYYFTGNKLQIFIEGSESNKFSIGCEFDLSVEPSWSSTADAYVSNYVSAVLDLAYNYSVNMYTDADSLTPAELAQYKAQQLGNTLQQESNSLQQKENDLQEEQNETTNNIFSSISDFFGSFFDNLIGIFVPEEGYFEEFFERLNAFFSDKLGMLYAPIDIFVDVLTAISEGGGSAGITFPELKWQEYVLIEEQTINLQSIANELGDLQDYIYLGTDVIMVGCVVNLLQNKMREVLKS